jgi:exopolyphosphatase / guanosine-5'-triphosphate,3'-diphosphate pyrophosphatase
MGQRSGESEQRASRAQEPESSLAARAARAASEELCASVDLGTHSALLLIARRVRAGALEVLEDHCASARLGAGAAADGSLSADAQERCVEILRTFERRVRLRGLEPGSVRAAGTAVLRRAPNAGAFIDRLAEEFGFRLAVIPGELEGRLGYLGAFGSQPEPINGVLLDLGGGSTEVAWQQGQRSISVPFGAVVATEQLLGASAAAEPILGAAWQRLEAGARAAAEGIPKGLCGPGADLRLIGGSASNLACLELGLESFDPRLAEGCAVGAPGAWRQARRLAGLPLEARRDLPIEPDRALTLPAALAGLGALLERLGASPGFVTGRGLRHGLLLWPRWPPE